MTVAAIRTSPTAAKIDCPDELHRSDAQRGQALRNLVRSMLGASGAARREACRSSSVFALGAARPKIARSAFLAPGASVIGDVVVGEEASIWFSAVIRGDNGPVRIGAGSNVQDLAVLHAHPGNELHVGRFVSVGHQASLHGCHVADRVLVGMQACVMDGAEIGEHSIVAAAAVVTKDKRFAPGVLIQGAPARAIRSLTAAELDSIGRNAAEYSRRGPRFSASRVLESACRRHWSASAVDCSAYRCDRGTSR